MLLNKTFPLFLPKYLKINFIIRLLLLCDNVEGLYTHYVLEILSA